MNNNNNNLKTSLFETEESDECLTRGICTVNSTLTSLQEVILLHLKELAFYVLKLKEFGTTNDSLRDAIVEILFNLVTNAEYNQEQFHKLIFNLHQNIAQSKIIYEKTCLEKNIDIDSVKIYFKYSKNFDLTEAIRKGEKYFLKKSSSFTGRQKDLFDIMLFLVKSVCIKMVESQRLEENYDDAYYAVLSMLSEMNLNKFTEENAKKEIEKFTQTYYDIIRKVFHAQINLYGDVTPTEVSFSTTPGKAILVSGSDYKKLEKVLKAVENTDISVYTHGMEMLMAHSFPKLHTHSHLKGHYGSGLDSSLIDFASFPGAILMTKGTLQKVEYLYRGRLFTHDPIAPMGVIKLDINNFEPLVKSAHEASGFTRITKKPTVKVGFSKEEIKNKIYEIADKLIKGEIKHLYIVGLLNIPHPNKDYFERFFKLLPKDCYAISMNSTIPAENIFYIDSFCDYSLIYQILKLIQDKKPLKELNISAFITKCDKHTISNLLYLKSNGIKNVYMCKCPPSLVNPALMGTLQEMFEIKEISDPQKDIEDTLKD